MKSISSVPLDQQRKSGLKTPYSTRRVPLTSMATLVSGDLVPKAGDLVLARVEKLGQHKHLELPSGRRARLFAGDEIILAYGNRYAPDQFESYVPEDLSACHLVASGGIASRMTAKHSRISNPTAIKPLGLVGDQSGHVINLKDYALEELDFDYDRPFTVAVVGTSMNAGKTEAATSLIRGLKRSGLRVGSAKVTGTGSGGDIWSMVDAGAHPALDFTDAGFATTFCLETVQVERVLRTLVGHLCLSEAEAIVLEVADGVLQRETADLVCSETFRTLVDAVIFAAGDAMGAKSGVDWLAARGVPVVAAAGLMTASPLAIREAQFATALPVLTLEVLGSREAASLLGVGIGQPRFARAI